MLSQDQVDQVRLVLATKGWNDVMRPAIEGRGRTALKALALTRSERARVFKDAAYDTDDDVLRAMIRECEWMVNCWTNELIVAEHNRRRDELDRQEQGP